jgi:hypothetical protein
VIVRYLLQLVLPACSVLCHLDSDPESEIPFTKALYGNDAVMKTFYKALSDDGILVMQLGESPNEFNPSEIHSRFKNRAATTSLLERAGFESIHVYEEVSLFCSSVLCFERQHVLILPLFHL